MGRAREARPCGLQCLRTARYVDRLLRTFVSDSRWRGYRAESQSAPTRALRHVNEVPGDAGASAPGADPAAGTVELNKDLGAAVGEDFHCMAGREIVLETKGSLRRHH